MAKKQITELKTKLLVSYILFALPLTVLLLVILWFLKPILIEEYCQKQANKIVGNQWSKLYEAEGYEKQYANQITWGFREQLKCERGFQIYFFTRLKKWNIFFDRKNRIVK